MALLSAQMADMRRAEQAINSLHEQGFIKANQEGGFEPV